MNTGVNLPGPGSTPAGAAIGGRSLPLQSDVLERADGTAVARVRAPFENPWHARRQETGRS